MATAEAEKPTIAYSSAATFITTLDHLKAVGIPNLIDRNALPPSFSGSSKYEMLGTLRFFDLIDKDGKPDRDRLGKLADPETRKDALLEILETYYPGLFALPLSSAGPTEIQRWFTENATPSTAAKAKGFFLALAKQTGVPMHSMVAKGARVALGSVRRKRRKKGGAIANGAVDLAEDDGGKEDDANDAEPTRTGETRTVALRDGAGSISVNVTVNLWELEGEDLTFVLGLMKALRSYEKGANPTFGTAESSPAAARKEPPPPFGNQP